MSAPMPFSSRDHPRSRGVYPTLLFESLKNVGSSPLARGLHGDEDDSDGPGRIIPARAGFTLGLEIAPRHIKDHPRSRGVYYSEIGLETADQGSSPLARGLLQRRRG